MGCYQSKTNDDCDGSVYCKGRLSPMSSEGYHSGETASSLQHTYNGSLGYYTDSVSSENDCLQGDLHMEIAMMSSMSKVMSKTSSPLLEKRLLRSNEMRLLTTPNGSVASLDEVEHVSYSSWMDNLEHTPTYANAQNITKLPEALSGQFTPRGFPVYTNGRRLMNFCRRRLVTELWRYFIQCWQKPSGTGAPSSPLRCKYCRHIYYSRAVKIYLFLFKFILGIFLFGIDAYLFMILLYVLGYYWCLVDILLGYYIRWRFFEYIFSLTHYFAYI